jgi:hypothetical protein
MGNSPAPDRPRVILAVIALLGDINITQYLGVRPPGITRGRRKR